MELLSPLFLAAAAAVAVPLLLHLLHRRVGRRRAFPALRYLRRTEREHASRIRLRQLLLLLLRVAALLLVVLAAARPVLRALGGDHEPTALALVLDNSMSTGMVVDDARVVDGLRQAALSSIAGAGPEDRIWVFRAGEPWRTPVPGGREAARERLLETGVSATRAPLLRIVARARALVADADLPAAEVHVFTDLQATSWSGDAGTSAAGALPDATGGAPDAGSEPPPVLLFHPEGPAGPNRWIGSVNVGGGLPPLVNQRTSVGLRIESSPGSDEGVTSDTVRARLVLDGRITAAVDAPVGEEVLVPAGPFAPGIVRGAVEIDPDALRTDDRRHFAFRIRPPPRVDVAGEPGFFLDQALAVLADADRIRRGGAGIDVLVAPEARGLAGTPAGAAAVLLPPADPALLPAANRRLREGGIPWRLEPDPRPGELRVRGADLPVSLDRIRVTRAYRIRASGEEASGAVRARRADGEPWLVTGRAGERPYLLLASPLEPEATTLPLTAEMLPVVEWMVAGWAPGLGADVQGRTGAPLALPGGATGVRDPDGTLHPVDGTLPFRNTGSPGIYEIVRGDSVLERVALNPPALESRLERLGPAELLPRLTPPVQTWSSPASWPDRIFLSRRGREIWRPLLLAALAVLALESLLAAGGRGREGARAGGAAGPDARETPQQTASDLGHEP